MAGNLNSGRKSKSEEQQVLEKLSLLDDLFFIKLEEALNDGKSWALRLFANHRIPKPTIEIKPIIEEMPMFNITLNNSEDEEQKRFIETFDIDLENQLII